MIARSLGFALFCCVVYALTIPSLTRTFDLRPAEGASQQDRNVLQAENYAFSSEVPDVLLVGSSIMAQLKDLPARWGNLAFTGDSSLSGLELIAQKRDLPKVVVVETNVLDRPVNPSLVELGGHSPFVQLKRAVPAFRKNYAPVLVARGALLRSEEASRQGLKRLLGKPAGLAVMSAPADSTTVDVRESSESIYQRLLADRKASQAHLQDPGVLAEQIANLKRHLAPLLERGVQIVLAEIPGDPATENFPEQVQRRQALAAAFPAPDYRWLPVDHTEKYLSNDAVHLTRVSAGRYTRHFVQDVGALFPRFAAPARALAGSGSR